MNTIPPITDPLGAHWQQPSPADILIDDTHAVMTEAVFKRLLEYSTTRPGGVYPGKMWRRHDGVYDRRPNAPAPVWLLCWFGIVPGNDKVCSNNYRKILIT